MKWFYLKKNALYLTEADLNKLGEKHWELIGFDQGNAYFKRPLQLAQQSPKKPEVASKLDTVLTYKDKAIEVYSKPYPDPTSFALNKLYRYQIESFPEGSWTTSAEDAISMAKNAIDEAMAARILKAIDSQ